RCTGTAGRFPQPTQNPNARLWRKSTRQGYCGKPDLPFPLSSSLAYNPGMEHELLTIQNVKDLQDGGKRWLENVLGQHLRENQQVFIMVFTPGVEPDEAARRGA